MPFSEKVQHLIAASLGLSGPAFAELAVQAARQGDLMSKAMFITGRTQEEIRAAVARSPYSFAAFVSRLAAGLETVPSVYSAALAFAKEREWEQFMLGDEED